MYLILILTLPIATHEHNFLVSNICLIVFVYFFPPQEQFRASALIKIFIIFIDNNLLILLLLLMLLIIKDPGGLVSPRAPKFSGPGL